MKMIVGVAVMVAGIATHELSHYAVCRRFGVNASFGIARPHWYSLPAPCVTPDWIQMSPHRATLVGLAPVAMFVPVVGVVAVFTYSNTTMTPDVSFWVFIWCLTALPSATDLKIAWNADRIEGIAA